MTIKSNIYKNSINDCYDGEIVIFDGSWITIYKVFNINHQKETYSTELIYSTVSQPNKYYNNVKFDTFNSACKLGCLRSFTDDDKIRFL